MEPKRNLAENRPCSKISFAVQDTQLTNLWTSSSHSRAFSRLHNKQIVPIYTSDGRNTHYSKKISFSRHQRIIVPVQFHSARGSCYCDQQKHNNPVRVVIAVCRKLRAQRTLTKEANNADREFSETMVCSEDCFHCRDLQAEFEELRAQQRALEDQVRSLETRMEDQFRVLNEKYRAEINLFLHRVNSLHEQFSNLSSQCSHAEESIVVLKFMMDKKFKETPSSSSAKQNELDPNPEGSTARKISHIEID